jgi:hypothetical protein
VISVTLEMRKLSTIELSLINRLMNTNLPVMFLHLKVISIVRLA